MTDEDHVIPSVRMDQTMTIASMMLFGLIQHFIKPEDSEEQKVVATYICLAVFFQQLASGAKHKDKMAGILRAIIAELESTDDHA